MLFQCDYLKPKTVSLPGITFDEFIFVKTSWIIFLSSFVQNLQKFDNYWHPSNFIALVNTMLKCTNFQFHFEYEIAINCTSPLWDCSSLGSQLVSPTTKSLSHLSIQLDTQQHLHLCMKAKHTQYILRSMCVHFLLYRKGSPQTLLRFINVKVRWLIRAIGDPLVSSQPSQKSVSLSSTIDSLVIC